MRPFGMLHNTFWTSPTTHDLSDQGKLLAIYLVEGPHTNALGCFRLPDGYVMEDLRWSRETVSKAFTELFAKGYCNRCETTNWVLITNFLKFNPPDNPNQIKFLRKLAAQVPESASIYQDITQTLERLYGPDAQRPLFSDTKPVANGSGTVAQPSRNKEMEMEMETEREMETETEMETEKSCATASAAPEPAVIDIGPLNDGSFLPVTQSQVDRWSSLYPSVDVLQQLRHMIGWCESNPRKRKTKAGALSFITKWLQHTQDRPEPNNGGGSKHMAAGRSAPQPRRDYGSGGRL